jgi:hypothetical protein
MFTRRLRCSFCAADLWFTRDRPLNVRKSATADLRGADTVGRLVAGPSVYICDACITTCVAVLEQNGGFPPSPPADQDRLNHA